MRTAGENIATPSCKLKKISTLMGTQKLLSTRTCQCNVSARPEIHRRYSRMLQPGFAQLQLLVFAASRL
jgi:hypothetical protein